MIQQTWPFSRRWLGIRKAQDRGRRSDRNALKFWKLRRDERETDQQPVAQHSRQELGMGREGCLKVEICCDR